MKPIAYLTISQGRVMVSYCVHSASGRLLWATRAILALRAQTAHGSAYGRGCDGMGTR